MKLTFDDEMDEVLTWSLPISSSSSSSASLSEDPPAEAATEFAETAEGLEGETELATCKPPVLGSCEACFGSPGLCTATTIEN